MTHQIWNKIYKTDIFREAYSKISDDLCFGEDIFFYMTVLNQIHKVVSIDEVFYYYRVRTNSISHSESDMERFVKHDNVINHLYFLIVDKYANISREHLDSWLVRNKLLALKKHLLAKNINVPYHKFPMVQLLFDKKIIIYGAGVVGRDYIMQLSEYPQIDIVKWVDRNCETKLDMFRKVESVDSICDVTFDYIIVAIDNILTAEQIKNELVRCLNISEKDIIWDYDRDVLL